LTLSGLSPVDPDADAKLGRRLGRADPRANFGHWNAWGEALDENCRHRRMIRYDAALIGVGTEQVWHVVVLDSDRRHLA